MDTSSPVEARSSHLQQRHERCDNAHAEHSVTSSLASAVSRRLAGRSRRRCSRRSLVLGRSGSGFGRRGRGGDDNSRGTVGWEAGRYLDDSAVLGEDDTRGVTLPERSVSSITDCGGDIGSAARDGDGGRDVLSRGLEDGGGVHLGRHDCSWGTVGERFGGRGGHETAADAGRGVGEVHDAV